MRIDRIVQGRRSEISAVFVDETGAAVDPPADTHVTVVRFDGTVLVNDQAAADATFVLDASQTADLDLLTATWTGTVGSDQQVMTTQVEIAGGVLFEVADAMGALAGQSAAVIAQVRTQAERDLERACGAVFVPRFIFETRRLASVDLLRLGFPDFRQLRSLSIDGVAQDLSTITFDGRALHFTADVDGVVVVAFEAGLDQPPGGADKAALMLANRYFAQSPIDPRATQLRTDAGTLELSLAAQDAPFGIPEVDAFVRSQAPLNIGLA
jgi:hypothetical protein